MRKLTKKEIQKRMIDTLGEMLSDNGVMPFAEARKVFHAIFLGKSSSDNLVISTLALFLHEYAKQAMNQLVRKGCTNPELERELSELKAKGIGLPAILRKGANEMKKKLPRRGGPGREHALRPDQQIAACELISTMMKTKKLSMPDVFRSVAENFMAQGVPVSEQTIKRVWGRRDLLYAG